MRRIAALALVCPAMLLADDVLTYAVEDKDEVDARAAMPGAEKRPVTRTITIKGNAHNLEITDGTDRILAKKTDKGVVVYAIDDENKTIQEISRDMIEQIERMRSGAGMGLGGMPDAAGGKKPGGMAPGSKPGGATGAGVNKSDVQQLTIDRIKAAIKKMQDQKAEMTPEQRKFAGAHYDKQINILKQQIKLMGGTVDEDSATPTKPMNPTKKPPIEKMKPSTDSIAESGGKASGGTGGLANVGPTTWGKHPATKWVRRDKSGTIIETVIGVEPNRLGIDGDFLAMMKEVSQLFKDLRKAAGGAMGGDSGSEFDAFERVNGVPASIDGKDSKSELRSAQRVAGAPNDYAVPNYKRQKMIPGR